MAIIPRIDVALENFVPLNQQQRESRIVIVAEINRLQQELGNLLAVIHRDGGHHTDEVGEEQSVKDAHKVWAEQCTEVDRLRHR